MHLSQIALFVAPLIAIVTAIVPNAAAMGTLAKKECLLPAQTCDPKKPQECCDNECKEAIPGSDTTCGGCYFPLNTQCYVSLENLHLCCQGNCVEDPTQPKDSDLGLCKL